MKILTTVWSIGIGGTERAAVNYAIGYKQYGVDSKVLVLGEDSSRLADLQEAGVDTFFLQAGKTKQDDILASLQSWAPDIIHLHNYTPYFIPYLDKLKAGHTKIVETNVFSRPHYDELYKAVSLSMQLSKWGYWKYTNWMKGAAYTPEVVVAPYTIYEDKFPEPLKEAVEAFLRSQEIPPGAFVAGRLGQAHPSKWDSRILDVVERTVAPDNNIYYLFVCMPAVLIAEIKKLSSFVQSRIKVIDKIRGDENLSLYYHSLDCFVHISKIGESFGYVLAEAMMCKVPVITMLTPFHDNAQFEVVGHDHGGICVTDTSEFVSAVMRLYNSPGDCERFRHNLSNHYTEKRFGAAAVIPVQIEQYSLLLQGRTIGKKDVRDVVRKCFDMYGIKKYWMSLFLKLYNTRFAFLLLNKIRR